MELRTMYSESKNDVNDSFRMYDNQNIMPGGPLNFSAYRFRNTLFADDSQSPVMKEELQVLDLRVRVASSSSTRSEIDDSSTVAKCSSTVQTVQDLTIYRPELDRSNSFSPNSSGDFSESAQQPRPASVRTEQSFNGSSDPDSSKLTKDEAYYIRRKKNNLAAKRSRDAKRKREADTKARVLMLEEENRKLREELTNCSCRRRITNPIYSNLYLFCNN